MAKKKPIPTITKKIGPHALRAERGITGGWFFESSFPEIALRYDGCHDATPALDAFEAMATAAPKPKESAGEAAA